jgi:predicted nucleotidyltransferase
MNQVRRRALQQLRQIVLDALGEHAAEVWLFGSCARGDVRQHSDVDIAIMPHEELGVGFFALLAERIDESTIPYDVDLVDLRKAERALVEAVKQEGVRWRN